MVTISVFYKKGATLKRGSPMYSATFKQAIHEGKQGFGVTTYVDLTIVNRTSNVYSVSTVTPPQPPQINIVVKGAGDTVEFGMNDGSSAEVWVGYER